MNFLKLILKAIIIAKLFINLNVSAQISNVEGLTPLEGVSTNRNLNNVEKTNPINDIQWLRKLDLNSWVLQIGSFDYLADAQSFQSTSHFYKKSKIFFIREKIKKSFYILINGPYTDKLQLENLIKQNAAFTKARVLTVKSLKEQIETQDESSKALPEATRFEKNYFQIEKELMTNITGSKKVMVVQIAIMTHYDSRVFDNIKKHEFALRSAMLDLMRQTTEADTNKTEFRKGLAIKLKDIMNSLLEEYEDFGGIEEVMFTSFILQ